MKQLKTFFQLAFVMVSALLATQGIAHAADVTAEQSSIDFVKNTAENGLTFLSKPNMSQEQRKQEFKQLLNSSFDMDTIARFTLGRYWNVATPAQQQEYGGLFRKMIVEVYAQRFGDYKGQKFEVTTAHPVGNDDVLVTSLIHPVDGGENIQVDWRVRNRNGTMKIVDVLVAGVSMSVTQRSDFSAVIQRGGGNVDVLIDYLKQKM
jgi:phospholipid transport system substrate-binding protein